MTRVTRHFWLGAVTVSVACVVLAIIQADVTLSSDALALLVVSTIGYVITARPGQ